MEYRGQWYFPVVADYPGTDFGPDFLPTEADYTDPAVKAAIRAHGWMLWPLVPYHYDTIVNNLPSPAPSPPTWQNWLGTDDQARDVLARVIYGFRDLGFVWVHADHCLVRGRHRGRSRAGVLRRSYRSLRTAGHGDLVGMPQLFLLIILSSIITPSFWVLLVFLLLFSWMTLTGLVRAEFLRGRNLEYVRAARALGVSDVVVMWRHVLPNAMVAVLTFLPFILSGSVTLLASLDFLGFGLPPGSPSLGELVTEAKNNLQAPWLGVTAFVVLGGTLALLIFIGEAVRDAFDPRKTRS